MERLERKARIILESGFDVRDIATILRYAIENGKILRSKASIVRFAVEEYVRVLVSNNKTVVFQSSEDALSYIVKMGYHQPSRRVRKYTRDVIGEERMKLPDLDDLSEDDLDTLKRELKDITKEV